MSRSFSDPSSSSNFNLPGKSYEQAFESIKKLSGEFAGPTIVKAPSLPPRLERKDRKSTNKGSTKRLANNLLRAPSLPTSFGNEEFDHDEETEFSMGKLIRQASVNSRSSNSFPPRTLVPKGATPSPTTSRVGPEKKPDLSQETRPNGLKPQKSISDSGFDFEKELSPNLRRTSSSLIQEKQRIEEKTMYASETWRMKPSAAPPVPKWVGKRSTEDVKAQIKFWARAVASNVRQEC